jgi:surfeit locus 1 family protein
LVPTLAFFVVFPVLVSLGFWQLDRAEEKRQIENEVNLAIKKPALVINQVSGDLKSEVYRRATVTGKFDSEHQFLWDNKTHQGRPGFHVLTPLLVDGQQIAVIVNRGWVPMLGRRDQLPDVGVEQGNITISGVIKNPSNTIQLADRQDFSGTQYPHIVQAFEPAAFGTELGLTFLPIMIELGKDEKYGYLRDWKPYFGKIDRHNGYALQWFLMALITLFLFVKLNTKRAETE